LNLDMCRVTPHFVTSVKAACDYHNSTQLKMSLLHNSVKSKSTQRNVHLAHFDLNLENFNLSSHASLNPHQNHHHTHTKLPTLLNTINTSPSHIYLHTRTHKNSMVSSLPHKPYTNTCSLGNPKPNHHLHCTQLIHTRSKQSSRPQLQLSSIKLDSTQCASR
jgi:hypothetical protein